MKSKCLYVDGIDVYKQFGVYVINGGYNELIAYPPLKDFDKNDWQEEDGIEADLSAPVLNTRELSLKFAVRDVVYGLSEFLNILSDGAYHTFYCAEIGRTYRLRLTQQPNLKLLDSFGQVTLKFADDFPLDGYTPLAPLSNIIQNDDYYIDNLRLTNYGIRVLKGSFTEITKTAPVKTNLLRNIPTVSGVEYDKGNVTFKTKDVKLQCLLRAETLDELWRNYDAFLYALIQPQERILWVNALNKQFHFIYKSCQVTKFYATDRIWLQFTLTITFSKDFRNIFGDTGKYLTMVAMEDGFTAKLSGNDCHYSINNGRTWNVLHSDTYTPAINTGSRILFKGSNLIPVSGKGIGTFSATKNFYLSGNCNSMLFGDNADTRLDLTGYDFAYHRLFSGCDNLININSDFLPATTLSNNCYESMFAHCGNLVNANIGLQAKTLTEFCYNAMFRGCSKLLTPVKINANTLAAYCCSDMYRDCLSLDIVDRTILPAMNLAPDCYSGMFRGCSSLKTSPNLPATKLSEYCYNAMFYSCISLINPPELHDSNLAEYCYNAMFVNCISLTIAPDLPAIELHYNYCYNAMFYKCSNLKVVRAGFLSSSAADIFIGNWLTGVAENGTIYTRTREEVIRKHIPESWKVLEYANV